jgi:hypothetical protein
MAEPVLRAEPLIERNEEPAADEAENVVRVEPWIIAKPNIVRNLRHKDEITEYDHPSIIAEKVDKRQIKKQSEICIDQILQNCM